MSWLDLGMMVPASLAALLAFSSSAPVTSVQEAHAAEIWAENDRWLDAYRRGDVEALGNLYTEDAKLLPEGSAAVVGRAAIVAYLMNMNAGGAPTSLSFSNYEFYGSDPVITEVTDTEVRDADGRLKSRGKQVLIFVKQDGQWKVHRDIWTRNGAISGDDH